MIPGVTAAEATPAKPVPPLVVAVTEILYELPLFNPETIIGDTVPVATTADAFPLDGVAVTV